ncbi:hypothetical protein DZ08F32_02630 [Escherichia coli]
MGRHWDNIGAFWDNITAFWDDTYFYLTGGRDNTKTPHVVPKSPYVVPFFGVIFQQNHMVSYCWDNRDNWDDVFCIYIRKIESRGVKVNHKKSQYRAIDLTEQQVATTNVKTGEKTA